MLDFDWYKVRFLESSGNLIPLVKARTGRTPSIQVAREIAACLQQGRQFYQSAIEAPIEIRPLLLFYGMTGFAKALVLADRVQSQSTLSQSHGLSDVSEAGCDIASLTLRIYGHGTFQAFNDVTKHLHRMRYRDRDTKPHTTWFTSSGSELLADLRVSLKEILARIPNLHILYSDTFNEPAGVVRLHSSVDVRESGFDHWTLAVSDREFFSDFDSLKAMIARWRERHAFLRRWRFQSARHFWDTSELQFENAHPTATELDPANMAGPHRYSNHPSEDRFDIEGSLPPIFGGYFDDRDFAAMPLNGVYVGEFSLHFMALFLLSCLVRYRPAAWSHAVSRTSTSDAPADDKALALIELFLKLNIEAVPAFVVMALNPNEDIQGGRVV